MLKKMYKCIKKNKDKKTKRAGFTLLELLIVIAVLAVLMTMAVITLNPAETLKKARDTQRITDLSTLKTAIGLYVAETASPSMGSAANIYLSVSQATQNVTGKVPTTTKGQSAFSQVATAAEIAEIDGTGWIPINFSGMTIGSPISSLPKDPTNSCSANPANTDKTYRYVMNTSFQFELDATFESTYYTTTIDLDGTDGGDSSALYEVGTLLNIIDTCAGS